MGKLGKKIGFFLKKRLYFCIVKKQMHNAAWRRAAQIKNKKKGVSL